jgi:hypothetical protein
MAKKKAVRVRKIRVLPSPKRHETKHQKVYSDELIAQALIATKGLQYLAAEKIGMSSQHLSERIQASEYLQQAREHAVQRRIDVAELNLSALTEEKELGAITFMLKTKGKERGYSETQQMTVDPQAQAGMLALMTQFADAQSQFSARKIVDSSKSEE